MQSYGDVAHALVVLRFDRSLCVQVHFTDSQTKPQARESDVCMTLSFKVIVVNSVCRRTGPTWKRAKS